MKKNSLILLLLLLSSALYAQPYMLTRGLPLSEIPGTGTKITGLGNSNAVGPFNIGFNFPFFENTYTEFYLNSNGHLSFENNNTALINGIPKAAAPNNVIIFASQQWNYNEGNPDFNYFTSGTAPNRILVVNFKNLKNNYSGANCSLQMQLYENTGKIEIHYTSFKTGFYNSGTIGLENINGSIGITTIDLNNNPDININNEAIRFEQKNNCTSTVSVTASSNILCNATSTLTATASIAGAYTYQWYRNAIAINGATSNTVEINSPGTYFVRMTNNTPCIAQSNEVEIYSTINPTIYSASSYVCNAITLNPLPSESFTYQWLKNDTLINGQNSASIIPQSAGLYKVKVTSGNCTISSNTTSIQTNTVRTYNINGNICNNVNLNLFISSSPGTLAYSWAGPNGFKSTASSPTINNASAAAAGVYTVTVNYGCNDIQTATTNVILHPNELSLSSSIYAQHCGSINQGFSSTQPSSMSYSWVGPNGFNSTTRNLIIDTVKEEHAGIYTLTVNFGCGDIQTATTKLIINPNSVSISTLSPINICNSLFLNANSTYTASSTYLWSGPNGFSSTDKNPIINNVTTTNAGTYTVAVNFGCGDVRTATKSIAVIPNSVSVYSSSPTNICGITYLSANSNAYTATKTYLWSGPNGFSSTESSPTISNTSTAHAGTYSVTVNFGCGDIQTATTTISVTPNKIDLSPSISVNTCGSIYLNTSTTYTPNRLYTWRGPNGFISTQSSPTITNASEANAGIYTVTIDFGCGDIQTATTHLTIIPNTISINPSISAYLCSGVDLSVSTSTPYSVKSYLWKGPNGFSSTVSNPSINTITNAHAGIYTVTIDFGCGDIQTATTNLAVTTNQITGIFSRTTTICNSTTLSFYTSRVPQSHVWSGPNGFSSTEASPKISNLTQANDGIYTITANFGCGDIQTATLNLTVQPNTIAIDSAITANTCQIKSFNVYTSHSPITIYSWAGPNGFRSNSNAPTINNIDSTHAGIYTVTVNFGCGDIQTATTRLIVIPNKIYSINSLSPLNLCGTTNLFVNSTYTSYITYKWTGPDNFNSIQASPGIKNATIANAGIYTVSINFGCGDIQTATTNVTIENNTLTLAPSFAVKTCNTASLYLNSSYTDSRTFSWAGPNGFSNTAVSPTIPNIDKAAEGFYTVTVNFGCGDIQTATTYVSVNPNTVSLPSEYKTNTCNSIGFSPTISSPGQSFLWKGPNGFSSIAQNATVISPTQSNEGIYTVSVNFGCGDIQTATTSLTTVSNKLLLASSITTTVCGKIDVYPSSTYTPIMTSSWAGPNSFSSTSNNLYINNATAENAGIYTVTVNFGCGDIKTATTNISVNANKIALNANQSVNLCGNITLFPFSMAFPSGTYSWSGPNGFNSTQIAPIINSVTNANVGIYTLTVNFGCGDIQTATTNLHITSNTLSLDSFSSGTICGIAPLNPTMSYTSQRNYSWVGPNSFSSSESNPVISNLTDANAGVYSLTVNFGCGEIRTATTQVIVNPNTLTTSASTMAIRCGTVNLYANASFTPSRAYSWAGPNGFRSNSNAPTINNIDSTHAGIYTVTVNFGCGDIQTATTHLSILPIPLTISNNSTSPSCPGKTTEIGVRWDSPRSLTASYIWKGPNGFSSNTQNPSFVLTNDLKGTYTVSVDFGICGISTATTSINMDTPVFIASSSQNLTFCEGNSIDLFTLLNNSPTEEIAGTTIMRYRWNGPDNFNSTERNPTISNLTTTKAGFYTVTVDLNNGCKGSYTSKVAINVTKNPELITYYHGSPSNCIENTVTLFSNTNPLGNTTVKYLWKGPNNFSSTEASPQITNLVSGGVYTLTAQFTGGCAGTYTSILPIFNKIKPLAQLPDSQSVCIGSAFILSASNVSGTQNSIFKWTGPNNFTSSEQYPVVSYNVTSEIEGIYTLTITDKSETCSEPFIGTTAVTVKECKPCTLSVSNSSSLNTCGADIHISAYLSPSYDSPSYSWTGPDGFSSESSTVILKNVMTEGIYTVTARSSSCGGAYTATTSVFVNNDTSKPTLNFTINDDLCEGNYLSFQTFIKKGLLIDYTISGPKNYTRYYTYKNNLSSDYISLNNITTDMSGIYTINARFRRFCSDTIYQESKSINVVVNPRPAPPTISGSPTSIDIGESTTLSSISCSNGNTLKWFNTLNSNTIVVNPITSANYWAICSTPGCNSISSNLVSVSVNTCPQQFILANPNQNYHNSIITKRAKANTGNITATNLITGNSNVIYQAKSILLNAGFKADSGATFKAETGGCN